MTTRLGVFAQAAEIVVVTLPAYRGLLQRVTPEFARSNGHAVRVHSGVFSDLKPRIDAGDFDVSISTGAVSEYLSAQGKTQPDSRVTFSRVGIGVAVQVGASKP